ncbi:hypothetical protein FRC19_011563 [Serendipita sp. 401]|nr:hypothetical protein FRC19_011563 [Serendipita sp. 401]
MGRQKTRPWGTSTDFNQLDRLRILVHQDDQDLQDYPGILAALHRAPLLRALSTTSSLYGPTNPIPLSLTHLHLYGQLDALPQLQLPFLKYLDLSIECRSETSQSTSSPFFSWVLPVLVTLRLDGEIKEEEGGLVQELVVKCSPTIVNLMLDLTILKPGNISRAPLSVIYPVLHLCPHLAVLGLSTSHLMLRTPIPLLPTSIRHPPFVNSSQPSARSLSLLVLGMTRFNNGNDDDQDDPSDDLKNSGMLGIFDREEVGYTSWSLARVLIPFTWSGLGAIWDERYQTEIQAGHGTGTSNVCHLAEPAWEFLNYFIGKKLEVFDADGVELHDEKNGGMTIFKPFM